MDENVKTCPVLSMLILFMHKKPHLLFTEAPKLDMGGLLGREIRVKAGEPFDIDIPIKGSPTPTVTWEKDNRDLGDSPRVSGWTSMPAICV